MAERIVVDASTLYARAAANLLHLMSGGGISHRVTFLIKPGEPVWRLEEADRG